MTSTRTTRVTHSDPRRPAPRPTRAFAHTRTILAVVASLTLVTTAAAATFAWDELPTLEVTLDANGISAPDRLESGYYHFVVTTDGPTDPDMAPEVIVLRLEEGTSVDEAIEALRQVDAAFMGEGHPGEAMARADAIADAYGGVGFPNAVLDLQPGSYVLLTVGPGGAEVTPAELTVTEAATPAAPPEADVVVRMVDFAFAFPADMRPGEQTWEVVNVGAQLHHLILVRVAEGFTVDDVFALLEAEEEPGEDGPSPVVDVAATNVLSTDVSTFLRFDLEPGDYVALCFMPDYETGAPHVALGMVQSFTVPGP